MTGQHLRDLPAFLRAPRAAGLWLVGVLIALASVVAFGLSYRGLFEWALHHQWPVGVAVFFPLIIDVPFVVCEMILFVAAIDGGTPWRVRALAWLVLLAFTAISVTGNADHTANADALTRGGFALPPVVLAIALGFGLGELKRQAAKYRGASAAAPVKPRLPSLREIQARRNCSQETAEKIRAELRLLTRNVPAGDPPGAPAPAGMLSPPAGVVPGSPPAPPAGAFTGGRAPG